MDLLESIEESESLMKLGKSIVLPLEEQARCQASNSTTILVPFFLSIVTDPSSCSDKVMTS